MELMKTVKSEEVVFGKGFVPAFGFFFTGTENELTKLRKLESSGEKIHIIIDPTGRVTLGGEEISSSK